MYSNSEKQTNHWWWHSFARSGIIWYSLSHILNVSDLIDSLLSLCQTCQSVCSTVQNQSRFWVVCTASRQLLLPGKQMRFSTKTLFKGWITAWIAVSQSTQTQIHICTFFIIFCHLCARLDYFVRSNGVPAKHRDLSEFPMLISIELSIRTHFLKIASFKKRLPSHEQSET